MNYRFKRDLKHSFMIIEDGFGDMGYERDILMNNDIDVLVPFHTLDINNITEVWYDITGLLSLKDYLLQQGMTFDLLRKVLVYLKIATDEIERYLIDINHILLDTETVYVVRNNNEWKLMFIYFPDNDSSAGLDNIIEFFMNNSTREEMDFYIKLYDSALSGTNIDGLIAMIDEETGEAQAFKRVKTYEEREESQELNDDIRSEHHSFLDDEDDIWAEEKAFNEMMNDGRKQTLLDKIKEFFAGYFDNKKKEAKDTAKDLMPGMSSLFSKKEKKNKNNIKNKVNNEEMEDFVFEPDQQIYEPTILLKPQEAEKESYELKYMGNNSKENIYLNKNEFLLGSSEQGNDGVIDSPVVSRHHAKIIREGKKYYLEDLNSTNGTTVNGVLLGYRDRVELKSDDEVMFADERYIFV